MLRCFALLTMTAAVACSNGRSTDPPTAAGSSAPRLTRFGDRVVLSWIEQDAAGVPTLRFAPRENHAWGAPRTAIRDARLVADTADVPSVVPLGGGGLAAHWTVKRDGSAYAREVMVAVSRDGGLSWSTPTRPHHDDTDTEHGMAVLLPADADGAFGVSWLDGRAGALSEYGEGGTSLYWADWSGDGFGPEVLLDARVCDCCKTSAATGPTGPVVAYRDRSEDERRDAAIVRRIDRAWSAPQPVHADGWSLSACPTNGPSIATRGERLAVAWFTGANAAPAVWSAFSADGGKTLGAPLRIDGGAPVGRVEATMLPDASAAVVWLERKGGSAEVRVRRVAPEGRLTPPVVVATTSPARAAGYPSIAVEGSRDVLVAWTETGSRGRVRAALVTLP
jgi:hypothetical protein